MNVYLKNPRVGALVRRMEGCSIPDCHSCKHNLEAVRDALAAAIDEVEKVIQEAWSTSFTLESSAKEQILVRLLESQ